jgi:hypothetical protein
MTSQPPIAIRHDAVQGGVWCLSAYQKAQQPIGQLQAYDLNHVGGFAAGINPPYPTTMNGDIPGKSTLCFQTILTEEGVAQIPDLSEFQTAFQQVQTGHHSQGGTN